MNGQPLRDCSILILTMLISFILMFSSSTAGAVQTTPDWNSIIQRAMMKVEASRLRETVAHLESYGNRSTWEKQWDAARWSEQKLREYGLDVALQSYEFQARQWPNVVARIKGRANEDASILLMAHLDSISDNPQAIAPGADDDGSGVAVLIETARILSEDSPDMTVIFCLFTNEERGAAGSRNFAGNAKRDKLKIHAVINLDVLGYNAPEHSSLSGAVQSHHTLKHKLKAVYRMVKNRVLFYLHGKDHVKMEGWKRDSSLVRIVSSPFMQHSGLGVREIIDDACD